MKKAENNEMELLLRGLARRGGDRAFPRERVTDGSAHSTHLDADELSSYAERTLPAATRARYTLHLADCARCRKIVAELAPVVSVSVRDHPEEQGTGKFWQTVRHLFSLPMWRYAVPALGLFAIVVVGIVVFRQQSLSGLTARNAPMPEQVAVTQNEPTEMPPQEKAAATSEPLLDSYSDLNAQRKAKSNEQGQAGEGAGAVAPAVIAKDAAVEKDAPADKTAAAAPQPTFAPEPAAPPAPKPQDQIADARKETTAQTEAAARPQSNRPAKQAEVETDRLERNAENRVEDKRARGRAEKGEGQAGATVSSAAPGRDYIGQRKAQTLRTDTAGNKAGDETAETRAVAGRRFRRQGNLWIDTAYQSGSSLTVISRGSEQYRALVADEPSIRTIAEQLQGEIILIWKGRGYRIR